MRIEFDPTNRDEATAVRAVLDAMYPTVALADGSGVLDVLTQSIDRAFQDGEQQFMRATRTTGEIPIIEDHAGEGLSVVSEINQQIVNDFGATPVLDANNEPHDPRIHSTPAKTNADGTWRAKRGVTAEQVAAVRAEREQAEAEENSGPIEIRPEDFKAHVEEMTNGAATVDGSGEVVKVSAAPTPPSAPPAPSGQSESPLAPETVAPIEAASTHGSEAPTSPSFLDVMKAITAAQKAGKVDTAKVKELCAAIGAGDSTMGLNGADKGELRVQFMALLSAENGE